MAGSGGYQAVHTQNRSEHFSLPIYTYRMLDGNFLFLEQNEIPTPQKQNSEKNVVCYVYIRVTIMPTILHRTWSSHKYQDLIFSELERNLHFMHYMCDLFNCSVVYTIQVYSFLTFSRQSFTIFWRILRSWMIVTLKYINQMKKNECVCLWHINADLSLHWSLLKSQPIRRVEQGPGKLFH